jgi:hypothetical protein
MTGEDRWLLPEGIPALFASKLAPTAVKLMTKSQLNSGAHESKWAKT